MERSKPVDCPLCGTIMAIHEDAVGAVAGADVGFYVTHPLWTPYPTPTSCKVHEAANALPKRATYEECAAAWERVAGIIASEGADGIFMTQLTEAHIWTPFAYDSSAPTPTIPKSEMAEIYAGVVEQVGGTNMQRILEDVYASLPWLADTTIVFSEGQPDEAMRKARAASVQARFDATDGSDR